MLLSTIFLIKLFAIFNLTLNEIKEFMLLEDISRRFRHPCAVDLKMGTRGFGDRETQEKKKRKQRKADQTTALSLGVRLSGMQVIILLFNSNFL